MPSPDDAKILMGAFEGAVAALNEALEAWPSEVRLSEIGTVSHVTDGIARVAGLPGVRAQELVRFPSSLLGIAANLDPDGVDVVLLGESNRLSAGDRVWRTEQVVGAPVGEDMIGRVVDGIGRPIDDGEPIRYSARRPIEREAPAIRNRAPVAQPLQTGLKVVDALIPIGRGQRELILGDRQTGKTTIAVDTMVNQGDKGVVCIYCAIGQRGASVAKVIAELKERDAMRHSIVVVASGEDPAGLQVAAPYTAMTIGEYFMERGSDVLIVYDDLTRHARAYRELSLLLRRPPGREAYPGDIFYIHSRLLERATHLRPELGGGSLTALPIVETQAQNLSAYIPTNLISITDGQIYLSPELFQKGILPAVDVGKSVSRVGGRAQLPAFRSVAGPLRLSYAQFEELETFARFGTRLDEETRRRLERGRRVREVLKQRQGAPMTVSEQIAVLVAATNGLFDSCALDDVEAAGEKVCIAVHRQVPELCQRIEAGDELSQADQDSIIEVARRPLAELNARPGKTDAQAR